MQRTFVGVTGSGVNRCEMGDIIARLEKKGLKLIAMKMAKGPELVTVWEGLNAINTGQALIGLASDPGSALGDTSVDSPTCFAANSEHEARQLIQEAFAESDIAHWTQAQISWLLENPDAACASTGSRSLGGAFVGSGAHSKEELMNTLEQFPGNAAAYVAVAERLGENDLIQLGGKPMTKRGLFVTAISLNPEISAAYIGLGKMFSDYDALTVDGVRLAKRDMFVRAISITPGCSIAYEELADNMQPHEIFNGQLDRRALYRKVVQLQPSQGRGYVKLANCMTPFGGGIPMGDGTAVTMPDLYLQALQCEDIDANTKTAAYLNLASLMTPASTVTIDGQQKNALQLYRRAYESSPDSPFTCIALAKNVPPNSTITFENESGDSGLQLTREGLFRKALSVSAAVGVKHDNSLILDKGLTTAVAYIGLARQGETVAVDGTDLHPVEMCYKAIEADPAYAPAWVHLAQLIGPHGSVPIAGTTMNQRQLVARALELDPHNVDATMLTTLNPQPLGVGLGIQAPLGAGMGIQQPQPVALGGTAQQQVPQMQLPQQHQMIGAQPAMFPMGMQQQPSFGIPQQQQPQFGQPQQFSQFGMGMGVQGFQRGPGFY